MLLKKKKYLLLLSMLLVSNFASAQTIVEEEIDVYETDTVSTSPKTRKMRKNQKFFKNMEQNQNLIVYIGIGTKFSKFGG